MRNLAWPVLAILAVAILMASRATARSRENYHKRPIKSEELLSKEAQSEDNDFWLDLGQNELKRSLKETDRRNKGVAKNILLFIGDGMSSPTLTAARIYKAQKKDTNNKTPEKEYLTFERFPHMGHSKTYNVDKQTPDSAATATSIYSGVKTKYFTLGYDAKIDHDDPESMLTATPVETVLSWAQKAGKDTGFVTTARITHATAAALYAHTYDRDWECDAKYNRGEGGTPPNGTHDIAWQLVNQEPGNKVKVILGGGRMPFIPKSDAENRWDDDYKCYRLDGQHLAEQWKKEHKNAEIVETLPDLMAVSPENTDHLLGYFGETHMAYDHERTSDDPSISNMTRKAISILKKNDDGFFLMVEGGRIDHAHHDSTATKALSETMALDEAVEAAMEMLEDELDETLIIVTADHSHTMTIAGYAPRGADISGLAGDRTLDDGLPYTILSYANGDGYYDHNLPNPDPNNSTYVVRRDLSGQEDEVKGIDFVQASHGWDDSETHGGDDVAIFARGPWAHLFHTTHEQTHIAHVMAYSGCLAHFDDRDGCRKDSGSSAMAVSIFSMIVSFMLSKLL